MKNKLDDLNNHLFMALERVNDDDLSDEELAKEIQRTKAITGVASQIIANGNLALNVIKMRDEALDANLKLPPMLESGGKE